MGYWLWHIGHCGSQYNMSAPREAAGYSLVSDGITWDYVCDVNTYNLFYYTDIFYATHDNAFTGGGWFTNGLPPFVWPPFPADLVKETSYTEELIRAGLYLEDYRHFRLIIIPVVSGDVPNNPGYKYAFGLYILGGEASPSPTPFVGNPVIPAAALFGLLFGLRGNSSAAVAAAAVTPQGLRRKTGE